MPAYHPEFGYLCPSAVVRQRIRLAVISAGVGTLIGAIIVLSLMDRQFADNQRKEQPWTAGRTDQAWAAKGVVFENPAAPVAKQDSASIPSVWELCKNVRNSFLDQECRLIKKRKAHASRSSATRLATIKIGRVRSTEEIGRSADIGGKSTEADGGPFGSAERSPAPSTVAPAGAAPAPTPVGNVRVRDRSRYPKGDGVKAFAYAPPHAQYYRHGGKYRGAGEALRGNWGWSW